MKSTPQIQTTPKTKTSRKLKITWMQIKYWETGNDIACVSNSLSIFLNKQKYAFAEKILIENYIYS